MSQSLERTTTLLLGGTKEGSAAPVCHVFMCAVCSPLKVFGRRSRVLCSGERGKKEKEIQLGRGQNRPRESHHRSVLITTSTFVIKVPSKSFGGLSPTQLQFTSPPKFQKSVSGCAHEGGKFEEQNWTEKPLALK